MAYLNLGAFHLARECFESNIESLAGERIRERFGEAYLPSVASRVWLVHVLAESGEFAEGIARGEEAVKIAEMVDHPLGRVAAYRGLGFLYLRKGDLDRAIQALDRCRELCEAWTIRAFLQPALKYLGYAYVLSGRLGDGLALLERGAEQEVLTGEPATPVGLACFAEAYALADRTEDALQIVNQALESSRRQKQRGHEAWVLRTLGEIAARRDPPDVETAETAYRQAMTRADELGMRPIVAHCHLGLGKLCQRTGMHRDACEHLTNAATMYREMGMMYWLENAQREIEELESDA
jgi:tetratricopeptide (TPR) repeat protein